MTNTKVLPPCADFIVETIRHFRPKRNTIQGVRLSHVYRTARELYSDEEIRAALNTGLKKKTLLITARLMKWRNNEMGTSETIAVGVILRKYPLESNVWKFISASKPSQTPDKRHTAFSRQLLYVIEDGLPTNVQALGTVVGTRTPTQAERILEGMRQSQSKK
jgi:hypothetical protein